MLQLLAWTLIPALVTDNASLDVIEGFAWGHEWQWGYHKGPPLFAWLLELTRLAGGTSLWGVFLLSQVCLAVMFYGVWRLASDILGDDDAIIAVLLLATIYYFNFPTPEFNPIILEFPFTALIGWIGHRALKQDRSGDWALLGALTALGMLSRYSIVTLLIPMAMFMLNHPAARRLLMRPGPYIALGLAILLISPHLLWMHAHGYESVAYVQDRARVAADPLNGVVFAARFALSQLFALAPVGFLVLILTQIRAGPADRIVAIAREPDSFDRLYISVLALGPFAFSIFISIVTGHGLRSMWGAPLWVWITLWVIMMVRPHFTALRLKWFRLAWAALFVLPLVAYAGAQMIGPILTGHERRTHFPGQTLAAKATEAWHEAYGTKLRYVVGRMWVAGNLAFYSADRPSVFIDANPRISPWIDDNDLRVRGGIVVWNLYVDGEAMPEWLARSFPTAVPQPTVILPLSRIPARMPVKVRWALLPPMDCPAQPAGAASGCKAIH
ncbi:MAG: glycosyltransferase family 39 protein [Proteobacteria bacterium]|nr:glycosyltransferase family 39 protein [Pseudomonadota bacterium]MBI3495758.1 glycosyltransferase family 39 protein [Pseudomonadota bacterium]